MVIYFEYSVELYEDGEKQFQYGVVTGESYPDACQNILKFYKNSQLVSMTIAEWDCEGCLVMSKEVLDQLREEDF
jgi:hypothetical protein